jgi:hypothetical protein
MRLAQEANMAGLADTTTIDKNTTMPEAQAQIATLDAARTQARGLQNTNLQQLFSYDKTLSDRYSSPDSKMYLEDAGKRQDAIAGYQSAGIKQVNNLYDITESVRQTSDKLQTLIDNLKKSAGSGGSTSLSLSDVLDFMNSPQPDAVPDPPQKLLEAAAKDPTKKIYYVKNEATGEYHYEVAPAGKPSDPSAKEWVKSTTPDRSKILTDTFGLDQGTLAKLSAVRAVNPKLADKLFASIVSSSVTSGAKANSYTTDDFIKQVKEYPDRASAVADLSANRQSMTAAGIDVARVEREIDTYFTAKEQKDAASQPFDLNKLKAARGGK